MSDRENNIQYCDIDDENCDVDLLMDSLYKKHDTYSNTFELNNELQKIFSKHHKKVCNFFNGTNVILANTDEELIPFMYVISHIALSNIDNFSEKDVLSFLEVFMNWANKFSFENDILKTFDERLRLYTKVVRNEKKPRYEWLMFNAPEDDSNFFARCHGVFGDILINPACANDYENAPLVIHDFFELVDFQKKMVGFYSLIKDFIGEVMACYEINHNQNHTQRTATKKQETKQKSNSNTSPIATIAVSALVFIVIFSMILIVLYCR